MLAPRFTTALLAALLATTTHAATLGSVSGTVFEETAGGRKGRPGVRVSLYRDGRDRQADGRDDRPAGSTATGADGRYSFGRLPAARYWLVVDSATLTPAAGLNDAATKAAAWAEQVSGPAGSLCADGQGATSPNAASGHCFGGRRASVSDDASRLATAEHVAGVSVAGAAVTGLDFGFSFDVVTDVRDADDESKTERSAQGTLRQFLQNAHAIKGENAMRFMPAVPATASGSGVRFWTVAVATALPALDDAGTILDGAAHSLADPALVLDTNPGALGGAATLGGAPLQNALRPELELHLASGLSVSALATIRHVAIVGAGVNVGDVGELTLEDAAIGVRADGTRPGPASLVGVSLKDRAVAKLARVLVADQKMHGLLAEGESALRADQIEVTGSGAEFAEGSGITLQSPGSSLEHAWVHGNHRGVALEATGASVRESLFEANAGEGLLVRQAGNRLSRNAFAGNGTAFVSLAAPASACAAPVLTSAVVGLEGDIRVSGVACPGESVEIYRGTPRPATPDAPAGTGFDRLEYLDTVATADCGVFAGTLAALPLDTQLAALANSPAGETSNLSPARALTLSQAPEAVVETAEGTFVIRLLPDLAPLHVRHFIEAALRGEFDGTLFHRSVPGELIQGGDPLSRDPKKPQRYGSGGLGLLRAEFSDRCFARGVVGAVRCPSNCDSAGNQFFVCLTDHPELRGQYTAFGDVLSGLEVVEKISRASAEGRPLIPMKVTIRQPRSF
jgi:cyclophilin family peptidyl-prolyl cis-trans isomerase